MIEVTPKEKPIVGNVNDIPKPQPEKPTPKKRSKRQAKAMHAAISSGNKSAMLFGLAGLAALAFMDFKSRKSKGDQYYDQV